MLFRVQNVAELIDQQVTQARLLARGCLRDDRGLGAGLGLNGRRFRKDPAIALIPWPARVDLAVVTRGAMRPMLKAGLSMLSSASAKALIWVISRVIRNCRASLLPASSQQLIGRS